VWNSGPDECSSVGLWRGLIDGEHVDRPDVAGFCGCLLCGGIIEAPWIAVSGVRLVIRGQAEVRLVGMMRQGGIVAGSAVGLPVVC